MKATTLGLLLVLGLTLGCVSSRRVEQGAATELAAHEGLLVVHVETAVPIKALRVGGAVVASNLEAGAHLLLVAMRAGRHRWTEIVIPAGDGDVPFRTAPGSDAWKFRVEAGRTNYPGQLVFGGRTRASSVDLSTRTRNRSALALRELRKHHPELLKRYPPVYGGPARDDYLDYFARTFLAREGRTAEEATR